jgi:hypothetical protein
MEYSTSIEYLLQIDQKMQNKANPSASSGQVCRPSAGNPKFPVRDGQATKSEILNLWIQKEKIENKANLDWAQIGVSSLITR